MNSIRRCRTGGDDFKQVAVRVFEVDTASAVVVIDLT